MKARKTLMRKEPSSLTVRLNEIGSDLYKRTHSDWVLAVDHIISEPVCPIVTLTEECAPHLVIKRDGDSIEEALEAAYAEVLVQLESRAKP